MISAAAPRTACTLILWWQILNRYSFFAALLLILIFCPGISQPAQLYLNKSAPHYAQEIEFYYLKPRPEMLPDMLKSFGQSGLLENAEKRLFIASFLAALIQNDSLDIYQLARQIQQRDASHAIALALHLARPGANISALLQPADQDLVPQITRLPTPLANWDPAWEKSALDLHWAAFMATGSNFWLDRIISCAINYAHGAEGSAAAAATLYDYAPRHPAIIQRLESFIPRLKESEQEVLKTILRHAYAETH